MQWPVIWYYLFTHFFCLSDCWKQTGKHPPFILRQPSCERGTAPLLLCCHGVRLWRTTWNARTPSPCGERICKAIQTDGPLNSRTFQSLLWTELRAYTVSHRRDAQHLCSRVHDCIIAFLLSPTPNPKITFFIFYNQKIFGNILLLFGLIKNRTMKVIS